MQSTPSSRRRVTLLLDRPAPHFSPAFRALVASESVDAHPLYWELNGQADRDGGSGEPVRPDGELLGYSWTAPSGRSRAGRLVHTVLALRRRDPEVVVSFGWCSPVALVGSVWALARRRPLILYGDFSGQHERTGLLRLFREGLMRVYFNMATGALSTSPRNRDLYLRYRMNPDAIVSSPCPVDTTPYGTGNRSSKAVGSEWVIGFVGKLIESKGADELLSALALLDQQVPWRATIVGDGPERAGLESMAAALCLGTRVEFRGSANQSAMPALLGSCDVVVVPSLGPDPAPIAVEAMASGAVVVVSTATAVWGPGELVEDSVTGLVYEGGDASSLAQVLSSLLENPQLASSLRHEASARLDRQSPAAFARSVEAAVARLAP